MTYTKIKERWDAVMKSRDQAIERGNAHGIEGNICLLHRDSAAFIAVLDHLLIKLAEDEKKNLTP